MEVVQVCPVIIFLRANETHLRRVFFSISILYPLGPTQVVREKKKKIRGRSRGRAHWARVRVDSRQAAEPGRAVAELFLM